MTVTQLLWNAAGRPEQKGAVEGVCRACSSSSTGLPFAAWVRPTFTNWDELCPGAILCHACQFCFAESSGLLARRVGKEKPQRMRNYSHFIIDGEWLPLSKGNKAAMCEVLLSEDWQAAVVAESGQKHIIFRAVPGVIQFEEQQIRDWRGLGDLLQLIEELYATFSKIEIGTGRYSQYRVLRFGLVRWLELENQIEPLRQSALFSLTLFLAQKGESDDRDARESSRIIDSNLAGNSIGL